MGTFRNGGLCTVQAIFVTHVAMWHYNMEIEIESLFHYFHLLITVEAYSSFMHFVTVLITNPYPIFSCVYLSFGIILDIWYIDV